MTQTRWWILLVALSAGLIGLDIVTGPYILFPILFVVPVGLGTWYISRPAGIGFAVGLVAGRFGVVLAFDPAAMPVWAAAVNAAIRLVVLTGLAVLVAKVTQQKRALAARVQVLEGLLPICAFCKKIRHPDGRWEQIEAYITGRSQVKFSHGFCEACGREHYPEVFGPGLSKTPPQALQQTAGHDAFLGVHSSPVPHRC